MLEQSFVYNPKLSIEVPNPNKDWDVMESRELAEVSQYWEQVREMISNRIRGFEQSIQSKQEELGDCDDFDATCQLVEEISGMAGQLYELNGWLYWNDPEDLSMVGYQG